MIRATARFGHASVVHNFSTWRSAFGGDFHRSVRLALTGIRRTEFRHGFARLKPHQCAAVVNMMRSTETSIGVENR
jgi:hypothetical protein